MNVVFELDLSPLFAWFEGSPASVRRGVERGLYQNAGVVMARSQDIVPIGGPPTSPYDVAPGTLKGSGLVLLPEWEGEYCFVLLGYGGEASDYAWRQHEDLTFRHKEGQQAKYLEQPFDEETPQFLGRIADSVQEELRAS